MGSAYAKERPNTFYTGNKVIYQLNDNKIRTGTITSGGSHLQIKDSKTNITHSVPHENVRHFHFFF